MSVAYLVDYISVVLRYGCHQWQMVTGENVTLLSVGSVFVYEHEENLVLCNGPRGSKTVLFSRTLGRVV